jgi:hypothetical protein
LLLLQGHWLLQPDELRVNLIGQQNVDGIWTWQGKVEQGQAAQGGCAEPDAAITGFVWLCYLPGGPVLADIQRTLQLFPEHRSHQ